MKKPIHKFFYEDLIEEQHRWSIDQIAEFYQTSQEEVINALAKANEVLSDNPLSTRHLDANSNTDGCIGEGTITQPRRDVQCFAGEDRVESGSGVVAGSDSS
tara:strand:- start:88 stop:393 length:306 start_codon:yes stop_codon:yes gene_type:complete